MIPTRFVGYLKPYKYHCWSCEGSVRIGFTKVGCNKFKKMSLLNLVLVVVACFSAAQSASISNHGQQAYIGQFKYQAYIIRVGLEDLPLCGGVILDQHYILTSACCVDIYVSQPEKIEAHYDTINVYTAKQKRKIFKIKIHDGYIKGTNQNNIALIRINKEIDTSYTVHPVKLPENDQIDGKSLTFSGFGKTFVS